MSTLSLAMIVKDEEAVLERCLSSVYQIVDEIIIVDTGSTDSTKKIARKFTRNIYNFTWVNDFSKARNFAFEKCSKDFILWLDADDLLNEDNQKRLLQLKNDLTHSDIDVLMAKYDIAFDESGNSIFSFYRERILRRTKNFKWEGFIHECIVPAGKIIYSDFTVFHKKEKQKEEGRNLKIFEINLAKGVTLSPREEFYYARELMYNNRTIEAITHFQIFLNTKLGSINDITEAHINLSSCYNTLGKKEESFLSLVKIIIFALPTPEVCCLIGDQLLEKSNYQTAIFWYTQATQIKNDETGGFNRLDYRAFYPFLQMCVCYYKLGKLDSAEEMNKKAGEIKPKHPSIILNNSYFEKIKAQR